MTKAQPRQRSVRRPSLDFLKPALGPDPVEEKLADVPFDFLVKWLAPRSLQEVANHAHAVEIVRKEFPDQVDALLAEWEAAKQQSQSSVPGQASGPAPDSGETKTEAPDIRPLQDEASAEEVVKPPSPSSPTGNGSAGRAEAGHPDASEPANEPAGGAEQQSQGKVESWQTAVGDTRAKQERVVTREAKAEPKPPTAVGSSEEASASAGRNEAAVREYFRAPAELVTEKWEPRVTINTLSLDEEFEPHGGLEVLGIKPEFAFAMGDLEVREFDVRKYPMPLAQMLKLLLRACEADKRVQANPRGYKHWIKRAYALPQEKIERLDQLGDDIRFYRVKATRMLRLAIYMVLFCVQQRMPLYRPIKESDDVLAMFGVNAGELVRGDHAGQSQVGTYVPKWVGEQVTTIASYLGVYPADLVEAGVDMVIALADNMVDLAAELRRQNISLRD